MLPGPLSVLVGLAHGSRHARVAEGVEAVLAATSVLAGVGTRAAYLDLTDPDLAAVAADLATAGVRRAVVVPLLFTDAFHARIDVPAAVTQAAESSGVELVLAPILGTGDDVVAVVADRLPPPARPLTRRSCSTRWDRPAPTPTQRSPIWRTDSPSDAVRPSGPASAPPNRAPPTSWPS